MRVLLINPPRSPHNAILDHAPAEAKRFIHKKLIGPPLGLLTVAAAVKDHEVALLEMKGEYDLNPAAPPPDQLVREYLARFRPQIVGVTFIASEYPAGMEILLAVRQFDPAIITVAGGLHTTLCPHDFAVPVVDVVCPGQSAHSFAGLVAALEQGRPLESVTGLYINGQHGLRYTSDSTNVFDPAGDGFLMPDRSLLARWLPTYTVGASPNPVTYLFTSLGCPYRCSFCSIWPGFAGRFFQRSVESIVAELATLEQYPVVRFADANTVVNTAFIEQLLDAIQAAGIRKEYVMDMRADTAAAHPKLVERLARAGLKVVICGFESFRDEELSRYNKSSGARLIDEAIAVFDANGIAVRGNYVVSPDYDERDFAALAAYAARYPVTYAGYTILTPMPGTVLYEEKKADIVDTDLARYNFFNCVLRTKLPLEEFYRQVGALWMIKKGLEVI
jgi:radical SAM superfamily enzyme YgiQ (UPF0313 family)